MAALRPTNGEYFFRRPDDNVNPMIAGESCRWLDGSRTLTGRGLREVLDVLDRWSSSAAPALGAISCDVECLRTI